MTKESLQSPIRELLPDAQRLALDQWEVVDNWGFTGYILNNGEQLEGLMGEHETIALSVFPDDEEAVLSFLKTGAIRFYKSSYVSFEAQLVLEPTFEQIQTLKRAIAEMPSMSLDITGMDGKNVKSYKSENLGQLLNDVRRVLRTQQSR